MTVDFRPITLTPGFEQIPRPVYGIRISFRQIIWDFQQRRVACFRLMPDRFDREIGETHLKFMQIGTASRRLKFDKRLPRFDRRPFPHEYSCDNSAFQMLDFFHLARGFRFTRRNRDNIELSEPRPNTKPETNASTQYEEYVRG